MKAQNWLLISLLVISLFLLNGCGSKKYADAEEVMSDYAEVMLDFVADMEAVGNAGDAANALNDLADQMEIIAPKMRNIIEKYPELENAEELPEELAGSQKKLEEASQKMVSAMTKMMTYGDDPEVQKVRERLSSIMADVE